MSDLPEPTITHRRCYRLGLSLIIGIVAWTGLLFQAEGQTVVTLDSNSARQVGRYSTQLILNGNPAVLYRDAVGWVPKLVRASNTSGTSWNAPSFPTAATSGAWERHAALQIVSGMPSMVLGSVNVTSYNAYYFRSFDANGSSWDDGTPIAGNMDADSHISLLVIGGRPAAAYSFGSYLCFTRANDTTGFSWPNTPVAYQFTLGSSYLSMADVGGVPLSPTSSRQVLTCSTSAPPRTRAPLGMHPSLSIPVATWAIGRRS